MFQDNFVVLQNTGARFIIMAIDSADVSSLPVYSMDTVMRVADVSDLATMASKVADKVKPLLKLSAPDGCIYNGVSYRKGDSRMDECNTWYSPCFWEF